MTSFARVFVLFVGATCAVGFLGCGSSGVKPTTKCLRDSECAGQLACVEGYCVAACMTSKDCMGGKGRCIVTAGGTTCEPPETSTCHFNSQCTDPLVCSADGQCRNQCQIDRDCAMGQRCTSITKLCADPTLDPTYDPETNEFAFASDGGASDGSAPIDGAGAGDGGVGDGADADGREAGAPNVCADAGVGLARFQPSNLSTVLAVPSALEDYTQTEDATFDTDTLTLRTASADGGADGGGPSLHTAVVTMGNGAEAAVLFFQRYTLAPGAKLLLSGQRAFILAANDTLLVGGTITTTKSPTNGWSGGGPPGPNTPARAGVCAEDGASGGGAAGALDPTTALGAGGGGFCGPGGRGSAPLVDGGTDAGAAGPVGGQPYGNESLIPLLGGSSGGSANVSSLDNHGGGAVELVAGTSVTIDLTGVVTMAGGGYFANGGGLGGGSGGGVLVEAPSITVRGTIAANGGSGSVSNGGFGSMGMASDMPTTEQRGNGGQGSAAKVIAGGDAQPNASYPIAGGGGGAGRIRFNTGCGGTLRINTGAIVSPSLGTPCTTAGALGGK